MHNIYRTAIIIALVRAGIDIVKIANALDSTPPQLDDELRAHGFTRVGAQVLHSPNELKHESLWRAASRVADIEAKVDKLALSIASLIQPREVA